MEGSKGDVFEDGEVGEEVELLEHHADVATNGIKVFEIWDEVGSIYGDRAGLIGFQRIKGANKRGFPGAGWTHDDDDFPYVNGQVDVS